MPSTNVSSSTKEALQIGQGALLLQVERPLDPRSRSLSDAETRFILREKVILYHQKQYLAFGPHPGRNS